MDSTIKAEPDIDDINALSNNKVDVEIEPDVKANKLNLCSLLVVCNCFSFNRPDKPKEK